MIPKVNKYAKASSWALDSSLELGITSKAISAIVVISPSPNGISEYVIKSAFDSFEYHGLVPSMYSIILLNVGMKRSSLVLKKHVISRYLFLLKLISKVR